MVHGSKFSEVNDLRNQELGSCCSRHGSSRGYQQPDVPTRQSDGRRKGRSNADELSRCTSQHLCCLSERSKAPARAGVSLPCCSTAF